MNVDVEELHMFGGIAQCANHSINFKIGKWFFYNFAVETDLDLLSEQKPFFNPKFTHQVFHKDETIKGMKDLSVSIFLSPTTLRPYVYWCCSEYSQNYDDVTNILRLSFGSDALLTDRNDFVSHLKSETLEKFKLPGEKVTSFKKNVKKDLLKPS